MIVLGNLRWLTERILRHDFGIPTDLQERTGVKLGLGATSLREKELFGGCVRRTILVGRDLGTWIWHVRKFVGTSLELSWEELWERIALGWIFWGDNLPRQQVVLTWEHSTPIVRYQRSVHIQLLKLSQCCWKKPEKEICDYFDPKDKSGED